MKFLEDGNFSLLRQHIAQATVGFYHDIVKRYSHLAHIMEGTPFDRLFFFLKPLPSFTWVIRGPVLQDEMNKACVLSVAGERTERNASSFTWIQYVYRWDSPGPVPCSCCGAVAAHCLKCWRTSEVLAPSKIDGSSKTVRARLSIKSSPRLYSSIPLTLACRCCMNSSQSQLLL